MAAGTNMTAPPSYGGPSAGCSRRSGLRARRLLIFGPCRYHFGGGAIPTKARSPHTASEVPPHRYSTKKKWNASGLSSRVGRPVPKKLGPAGSSPARSEEHTSELQSLMRISYAVFCLKKNITKQTTQCSPDNERRK